MEALSGARRPEGIRRRGASRKYSYYALPAGCDTVFFPAARCAGTRSEKVKLVYKRLKEKIPPSA